ncbi:UNVERIFIED_CONTAM: Multiple RNA-binding domain-containing protein 1 [Trichonephila clavipes]
MQKGIILLLSSRSIVINITTKNSDANPVRYLYIFFFKPHSPQDFYFLFLKSKYKYLLIKIFSFSHCLIRFASEVQADANYKALQGKELKGHLLNVDFMGEKSKNIHKKETKGEISLETLYVGNLPMDVTSDELKALSADIKVVCLPKKFPNPLNLYAFITFASKEEAYANYKALQGKKLRGRVLKIQFARENNLKMAKKKIRGIIFLNYNFLILI